MTFIPLRKCRARARQRHIGMASRQQKRLGNDNPHAIRHARIYTGEAARGLIYNDNILAPHWACQACTVIHTLPPSVSVKRFSLSGFGYYALVGYMVRGGGWVDGSGGWADG